MNVVFFSPEDLSIIKNGPSERRRFVDMELCQLDPMYLHNLNNYNKIVNQRNRLLKDMYMNPSLRGRWMYGIFSWWNSGKNYCKARCFCGAAERDYRQHP